MKRNLTVFFTFVIKASHRVPKVEGTVVNEVPQHVYTQEEIEQLLSGNEEVNALNEHELTEAEGQSEATSIDTKDVPFPDKTSNTSTQETQDTFAEEEQSSEITPLESETAASTNSSSLETIETEDTSTEEPVSSSEDIPIETESAPSSETSSETTQELTSQPREIVPNFKR